MTIDFGDLLLLEAQLTESVAVVEAGAGPLVAAVGEEIVATAEGLAPRLTGFLASSFTVDVELDAMGPTVVVSNTAEYFDYVEYGTSDTAPQPSLGPAVEAHEQDLADGAERLMLEALP